VKGHALAVTTIAAGAKGAFVTGAADGKVTVMFNTVNFQMLLVAYVLVCSAHKLAPRIVNRVYVCSSNMLC
jgi:hypothetical protein